MRRYALAALAVGLLVNLGAAQQEARQKELEKLQGTWSVTSHEDDGEATPKDKLKARKIFFGADQFIIKQGNRLMQIGKHTLDPTNGRHIDATILAGPNKGKTLPGIYEIKGDTFRVCFETQGGDRPTAFKSEAKSGRVLAVYQRDRGPGEEIDIAGKYTSESYELDGSKQTADVEIKRLGDAYMIKWSKGILDAYVGMGVRKGDTLSVSWVTKGQVGVSLYKIEKGPRLVGEGTMVGGIGLVMKETLSLPKKEE
jgi:uncharacterized protein (TIGR03067 family)